jgi:hypothetical protein
MLKLEHRHQALAPISDFWRRQLNFTLISLALVAAALFVGMAGYHWLESLPWLDSLLNASMILGGMGPVNPLATPAGKLFASLYALFSGMLFLAAFSVLVTPVVHRIFHRFHMDSDEAPKKKRRKR